MLEKKLTIQEQGDILEPLFGFYFLDSRTEINEESHYILYNEEGEEFYGYDINDKWDFSTLEGIFAYAVNRAKEQGYSDAQYNIQKALGIIP